MVGKFKAACLVLHYSLNSTLRALRTSTCNGHKARVHRMMLKFAIHRFWVVLFCCLCPLLVLVLVDNCLYVSKLCEQREWVVRLNMQGPVSWKREENGGWGWGLGWGWERRQGARWRSAVVRWWPSLLIYLCTDVCVSPSGYNYIGSWNTIMQVTVLSISAKNWGEGQRDRRDGMS